jgi:hypothetical protein
MHARSKRLYVRGSNKKITVGKGINDIVSSPINFALNNLPLPELHLRDGWSKRYSFCGPGTKLEKRIEFDSDGNPIRWITPPINALDSACATHDVNYKKFKDVEHRNVADQYLLEDAKKAYDNAKDIKDKANALLVIKIMEYKIKNKM